MQRKPNKERTSSSANGMFELIFNRTVKLAEHQTKTRANPQGAIETLAKWHVAGETETDAETIENMFDNWFDEIQSTLARLENLRFRLK